MVKVLFKRDLLSKMRMQLESGGERVVRDNRYIAVLMIVMWGCLFIFYGRFMEEEGKVGESQWTRSTKEKVGWT